MVNYRQSHQTFRQDSRWKPCLSACLLACMLIPGPVQGDIQTSRTGTDGTDRVKGPVVSIPTRRDTLPSVSIKSPAPSAGGKRPAPMPRVMPRTGPKSPGTYPWRFNITATVFWIGENPTANNPVPNHKSSWDSEWRQNYGGADPPDPEHRTPEFRPKTFVPRQNPFYIALPYNDVTKGEHKPEASRIIPWFTKEFSGSGQSVCKGRWVQIIYNKRSCFAQWEDCGPFTTEDWPYVFGDKPPVNTRNKGAGIDISPAVRDYLGIPGGTATVHWRFVEFYRIPRGPWAKWGDNNPFVNPDLGTQRKTPQDQEDRLRKQQMEIQRRLMRDPAKLRRELQG